MATGCRFRALITTLLGAGCTLTLRRKLPGKQRAIPATVAMAAGMATHGAGVGGAGLAGMNDAIDDLQANGAKIEDAPTPKPAEPEAAKGSELTAEQAKNLKRFEGKLPAGAGETSTQTCPPVERHFKRKSLAGCLGQKRSTSSKSALRARLCSTRKRRSPRQGKSST